jgi:hypothetical protein
VLMLAQKCFYDRLWIELWSLHKPYDTCRDWDTLRGFGTLESAIAYQWSHVLAYNLLKARRMMSSQFMMSSHLRRLAIQVACRSRTLAKSLRRDVSRDQRFLSTVADEIERVRDHDRT